jgi:hypothetical protein
MKLINPLLIVFTITLFSSCKERSKSTPQTKEILTIAIDKGKTTFESKCNSCHVPPGKTTVSGVSLLTTFWTRIPFEKDRKKFEWLKSYLYNSDSLLKTNDPYTASLKEDYKNTPSHNINLSDDELLDLIHYLRND